MPTPELHPPHVPLSDLSYDTPDVARRLKTSERTVRRLDAQRAIPGRFTVGRLVRFDKQQVDEWVRRGCPIPGVRKGGNRG